MLAGAVRISTNLSRHHNTGKLLESYPLVKGECRCVVVLHLELDGTDPTGTAVVIYDVERASAQTTSAVRGINIEIGDQALGTAELEIKIERQQDVSNRLGTMANDPCASQ
jgi:hypothetical protein